MPAFITYFYKKYILPIDPYYIKLGVALKSALSLVLSGLIYFYFDKSTMIWAILGALFTGMIQTGATIRWRKINMFSFLLLAVLVAPLFAWLSADRYMIILLVVLLTFAGIYAGCLNHSVGTIGMLLMVLCIVATRFSVSLHEIPAKSLALGLGGVIAYIIHFYIFPIKPRKIYRKAQSNLLDRILGFSKVVLVEWDQTDRPANNVHKMHHQILEQVDEFKHLPGYLNYLPEKSDGPKTAMIFFTDVIIEFLDGLMLISNLLNKAKNKYQDDDNLKLILALTQKTFNGLETWKNEIYNTNGRTTFDDLTNEIHAFQDNLIEQIQASHTRGSKTSLLFLQLAFQLKKCVEELKNLENYQQDIAPLLKDKIHVNFTKSIKTLYKNFNLSNKYFRYTLQITLATLLTMVVYKFFKIPHGIWLVMFCVIVMKPNRGSSLKLGIYRIIGTLIGVFIAYGLVVVSGRRDVWMWAILVFSVVGFLYLSQSKYVLLNVIFMTVSMITLYSLAYPKVWDLSVIRSYDTFLAVVIGVLISFLVWPNKANKELWGHIQQGLISETNYLALIRQFLKSVADKSKVEEMRLKTHKIFDGNREMYQLAMLEPGRKSMKANTITPLLMHEYALLTELDMLYYYLKQESDNPLIKKMKASYLSIFDELIDIMKGILDKEDATGVKSLGLKERIKLNTQEIIKRFLLQMVQNNSRVERFSNFISLNYSLFRLIDRINKLQEFTHSPQIAVEKK